MYNMFAKGRDPESEESKAYFVVFGKGRNPPPDEGVFSKVLTDFVSLFPDGSTKPGKARGAGFKITKYQQVDGFKKSSAQRRSRKKWDKEMFTKEMENRRGWTKAKSLQEWDMLLSNSKVKQYGGGTKENPLRLGIPSFLTGESESASEEEQYQQKQLLTESKGDKNLGKEAYDNMHKECARGFRTDMSSAGFASTVGLALGSTAITSDEVGETRSAIQIMTSALSGGDSVVDVAAPVGALVSLAGIGSVAAAATAAVAGTMSTSLTQKPLQPSPPPKQQDISILRNRIHDTQRSALDKHEKDIEAIVVEARGLIDSINASSDDLTWQKYTETLVSRVETCELFLGKQRVKNQQGSGNEHMWVTHRVLDPVGAEPSEEVKDPEKVAKAVVEPKAAAGQTTDSETKNEEELEQAKDATDDQESKQSEPEQAKVAKDIKALQQAGPEQAKVAKQRKAHKDILQETLRNMEFCPIESSDMLPLPDLVEKTQSIMSATSALELEDTIRDLAAHFGLASQLSKSTRAALVELKRKQQKAEKDRKAQGEKDARTKAEEARQAAEAQEKLERRRLAALKDGKFFNLKFAEAGHTGIPTYSDLDGLRKAIAGGDSEVMSRPFLLASCDLVQKMLNDGDGDGSISMQKTMERWMRNLPTNRICMTENKVVAPLSASMGLEKARKVFQSILPEEERLRSNAPSFSICMETARLYGHSPVALHFEPSMCGSLRIQAHGTLKVVTAPISDLLRHSGEKASWNALADSLRNLTQAEAAKMQKDAINLYHGSLEPNMVLMIPPAYFVVTTTVSGTGDGASSSCPAGLRETFLPAAALEWQRDQFQKLLATTPSDTFTGQLLQLFLDVVGLATQAAT